MYDNELQLVRTTVTPMGNQFGCAGQVGHFTWFELQKTLAEGLPEGTLQLGCSLESLKEVEDGVLLHFTGGRSVHAKVAIGADGNQSKTRALLFNDGQPSYAGQAVWLD
jgi:salicylate hydroxylase